MSELTNVILPDPMNRFPKISHSLSNEQEAARDRFIVENNQRQDILDIVVDAIGNQLGNITVLDLLQQLDKSHPGLRQSSVKAIYDTLSGPFIAITAEGLMVHPLEAMQ